MVQFGDIDAVVVAHRRKDVAHLQMFGYVHVTGRACAASLASALRLVNEANARDVWRALIDPRPPSVLSATALLDELLADVEGIARLVVFERRVQRGFIVTTTEEPTPVVRPARTSTEHWLVVEARDSDARSVAGLRIELIIAGGEIVQLRTNELGVARTDRLHAGSAVIALPDLDADMWRAEDGGAPQQLSRADMRVRWHTVVRGACASRIAARYGLSDHGPLWKHPQNAALRSKRKSPHMLLPGDVLAVPGVRVGELVRPTDSVCKVTVLDRLATFRLTLQDHNQQPFVGQAYELRTDPTSADGARKGVTDARGGIVERVHLATQRVVVSLPALGLRWVLRPGALVAVPTAGETKPVSGSSLAVLAAQQRLNARGFPCGSEDGIMGPRTRAALALFGARSSAATPADDHLRVVAALADLDQPFVADYA